MSRSPPLEHPSTFAPAITQTHPIVKQESSTQTRPRGDQGALQTNISFAVDQGVQLDVGVAIAIQADCDFESADSYDRDGCRIQNPAYRDGMYTMSPSTPHDVYDDITKVSTPST